MANTQYISDDGLHFIAHWEGLRLRSYIDAAGYPTIGYGHRILPGEHLGTISPEQAMELLRQDIGKAETCVDDHLESTVSQNQFDALVSFTYNVGCQAFWHSRLLMLLNSGRLDEAAREFANWCHAGGKVVSGLLARRQAEAELFLTPDADSSGQSAGGGDPEPA